MPVLWVSCTPLVQLRASAQLARLQDAGGVPAESRLCRCGKQTTLPTSAQPRLRRLRDNLKAKPKRRNSSYHWVRNRGQVSVRLCPGKPVKLAFNRAFRVFRNKQNRNVHSSDQIGYP